jgi:hypothetical protein
VRGLRPLKQHPVPLAALTKLGIALVKKRPAREIARLRKKFAEAKEEYGWQERKGASK